MCVGGGDRERLRMNKGGEFKGETRGRNEETREREEKKDGERGRGGI